MEFVFDDQHAPAGILELRVLGDGERATLGQGQGQREARSAPDPRGDLDLGPENIGKTRNDREAEPQPPLEIAARIVNLIEFLENLGLLSGGDADAGVDDVDFGRSRPGVSPRSEFRPSAYSATRFQSDCEARARAASDRRKHENRA